MTEAEAKKILDDHKWTPGEVLRKRPTNEHHPIASAITALYHLKVEYNPPKKKTKTKKGDPDNA